MHALWQFAPHFLAMAVLLCCSAFFSGSEAALFYLGRDERRQMQHGTTAQRFASELLNQPDRLLTAILFWNLVINITYFALVSIVSTRLEAVGHRAEAGAVAIGSLMMIILLSEMLPKNIAVLKPRLAAELVAIPLAVMIRLIDPLMPTLRALNAISRRLLIPRFESEPYLELGDLERAVELSTQDKALAEQEHVVLQNIIGLSTMRVEEVMRPRLRYQLFRPPVKLSDLEGQLTPSGYLLTAEPQRDGETDGEQIATAIPLKHMAEIPTGHLEYYAEKVLYVPWCATVAHTLEEMHKQQRRVAAVINEYGDTVGIVTLEDLIKTVLLPHADRSERDLQAASITAAGENAWTVTGMTTLRRLARQLDAELPETRNVTVAGVLQEELQRFPQRGDVVYWGGFRLEVLRAPERGVLSVRVEREATP